MSVKDNSCGIADIQDKMLDILKYFIEVCENNGLRYCTAGGTTLGVLRHQGFIPWDDDLDVYMPRYDYEKLWLLLKDVTHPRFKLCRTTLEKNYHHRVMQIVDITTTFINSRNVNEDLEQGVYIDIIPIDAHAKSLVGRLHQMINTVLFSVYNIQCKQEFNGGNLTKYVNFGTRILLALVPSRKVRYIIWKHAEKQLTKYTWEGCDEVICLLSTLVELRHPFKREWFRPRKAEFEDIMVSIPSGAEDICRIMYGDYMTYPSKEKQTVKHHTEYIDLNNPYTKYKGIYYCVDKK